MRTSNNGPLEQHLEAEQHDRVTNAEYKVGDKVIVDVPGMGKKERGTVIKIMEGSPDPYIVTSGEGEWRRSSVSADRLRSANSDDLDDDKTKNAEYPKAAMVMHYVKKTASPDAAAKAIARDYGCSLDDAKDLVQEVLDPDNSDDSKKNTAINGWKVGQHVKIDGKSGVLTQDVTAKYAENDPDTLQVMIFKEDKTGKTYEVNDHDLQSFNSMKNGGDDAARKEIQRLLKKGKTPGEIADTIYHGGWVRDYEDAVDLIKEESRASNGLGYEVPITTGTHVVGDDDEKKNDADAEWVALGQDLLKTGISLQQVERELERKGCEEDQLKTVMEQLLTRHNSEIEKRENEIKRLNEQIKKSSIFEEMNSMDDNIKTLQNEVDELKKQNISPVDPVVYPKLKDKTRLADPGFTKDLAIAERRGASEDKKNSRSADPVVRGDWKVGDKLKESSSGHTFKIVAISGQSVKVKDLEDSTTELLSREGIDIESYRKTNDNDVENASFSKGDIVEINGKQCKVVDMDTFGSAVSLGVKYDDGHTEWVPASKARLIKKGESMTFLNEERERPTDPTFDNPKEENAKMTRDSDIREYAMKMSWHEDDPEVVVKAVMANYGLDRADAIKIVRDMYDQHTYPMSNDKMMNPGTHVDEALWTKAKDAAKEAGADDLYAFATWWYKKHGGKF